MPLRGNSPSGGPEGVGRGMRAETRNPVQHNRPTPRLDIVTRSKSLRFWSSYVTARIPLQSPIGSEEPIGDSFSPGEAILRFALGRPGGRPLRCLSHPAGAEKPPEGVASGWLFFTAENPEIPNISVRIFPVFRHYAGYGRTFPGTSFRFSGR